MGGGGVGRSVSAAFGAGKTCGAGEVNAGAGTARDGRGLPFYAGETRVAVEVNAGAGTARRRQRTAVPRYLQPNTKSVNTAIR